MATVTAPPTDAITRLQDLCERAGYTNASRELIAGTLFTDYTPGAELTDEQLEQLCWAVEVLAQGGRDAEGVAVTVAHWRDTGDANWRDEFWSATIQTAKLRFSQPEAFGLSPLESDPERVAQHGGDLSTEGPAEPTGVASTAVPPETRAVDPAESTELLPQSDLVERSVANAAVALRSRTLTAVDLARSIELPRVLPPDYKGEPIKHLSLSSMMKYLMCPDDWRRHYLKGERGARSGAMLLGTCVDGALGAYYEHLLTGAEALALTEMQDAFRDLWRKDVEEEKARHGGVLWEEGTDENSAFGVGLEAVEVTFNKIVPRLGRPLATQRKFELRLVPDVEWIVIGYVDLDSVRSQLVYLDEHGDERAIQDTGDAEPTVTMEWGDAPGDLRPELKPKKTRGKKIDPDVLEDPPPVDVPLSRLRGEVVERDVRGIVDYKVKRKPIYQGKADVDPQATLYIAERQLIAGVDVHDFTFAQVAKASVGDRLKASTTVIRTRRSRAQMLSVFVRMAQVAAQIDANYKQFGPDKVWGFAEAGAWKCSATADGSRGKFCTHFSTCPMGRGFE